MWVMVSGPYSSGGADERRRHKNLMAMNRAAVGVFRKGHLPVIGVNAALPLIEAAGQSAYEEIMMPVSMALAERCDAVLRIGGPSSGADQEVEYFREKGLPIYLSLDEIPDA